MEDISLTKKNTVKEIDSEYRYKQGLETLPVAVYTCDAKGYILSYNKTAAKLWGREPIIGKDLWYSSWRIYTADGKPLPSGQSPMALALEKGKTINDIEIIIERPDGVRRHIVPHPRPILDTEGKVVEVINMLVDITDYRQAIENVRLSEERYNRMANQVHKARELKKENLALTRSNNELEQFAYMASHDMQEPLRKIQTFAELLEKNLDNPIKSPLYVDKIIDSSRRMMGLIKDLLNFSRLSKKDEPFTEVDLNKVLVNVISDFEITISDKQAIIYHDLLPKIYAIPFQINQLFYNLVSNSLKFSRADVSPVISITSTMMPKDEINDHTILNPELDYYKIEFSDNGIGFAQEYAEQIFTIFQRLNSKQAYSGTGIGLALCKKIARNHFGEIYAFAKEGEGATFYIVLPATQPF